MNRPCAERGRDVVAFQWGFTGQVERSGGKAADGQHDGGGDVIGVDEWDAQVPVQWKDRRMPKLRLYRR